MIQIQELHIGNIISYQGNQRRISGITKASVNLEFMLEKTDNPLFPSRYKEINIRKIEPVLINGNILIKCGFLPHKKEKTKYLMQLNEFHPSSEIILLAHTNKQGDVRKMGMIQGQNLQNEIILSINKLHQLQNIFYILTGDELCIEPESDIISTK